MIIYYYVGIALVTTIYSTFSKWSQVVLIQVCLVLEDTIVCILQLAKCRGVDSSGLPSVTYPIPRLGRVFSC